jgi:type VI secretion system secreted protein VgrG
MAERTEAVLRLGEGLEALSGIEQLRWLERVGDAYEIVVEVAGDPQLDLLATLGQTATLELHQPPLPTRRAHGVVWRVSSPSGPRPDGESVLELTIVPALSLLGLGRDTRIFQDKTVPEILEEVLSDALAPYGRSIQSQITGTYSPREYCVQYQESDLDFVHRLMGEEGIFYSFDFEGEQELLVLHDGNGTLRELAPGSPFLFDSGLRVAHGRFVSRFEQRLSAASNAVVVTDWDWTGPRRLDGTAEAESTLPVLEVYEHGRGRTLSLSEYDEGVKQYQAEDGARQATVRLERERVGVSVGEGTSTAAELVPGSKITLVGHPSPGLDGDYVVTSVAHELRTGEGVAADADRYANRFTCIPADTPFRPSRMRKPTIGSIQTATVVGPAGEEIHTDAHGRVKVQFHWDRDGANDEHSSCWLRVRQPWAGDGWGFLFLPRIGMEVVVSFMGGDPDRPLVLGCVYNGSNRPPYSLPDEKTKSTIKTQSTPGGGGFNELRFEDKSGSEQIYIHAQKDFNERIKNDHSTWVGGNQTNKVSGNQTQDIGDWQDEKIDVNQEMYVTGHRKVTVGGDFTELIDTGEDRNVTGGSTEDIQAGEMRLVDGSSEEEVADKETRTVTGGMVEICIGTATRGITGDGQYTSTDAFAKYVTGALSVSTTGSITVTATGGVALDAVGPITASGGPLVEYVTPKRTDILKVKLDWGLMKLDIYGVKSSRTNEKYGMGATSAGANALKLDVVYGAKIEIGSRKGGLTGVSIDGTALRLGADVERQWLGFLIL